MQFILSHWELFAALAIVIFLLILTAGNPASLTGCKTVDPQEAVALMNDSALVLDLRPPEESRQGRVSRAVPIPMAELAGRVDELGKNKERPILLVSGDGRGTSGAAKLLRAEGFNNLYRSS